MLVNINWMDNTCIKKLKRLLYHGFTCICKPKTKKKRKKTRFYFWIRKQESTDQINIKNWYLLARGANWSKFTKYCNKSKEITSLSASYTYSSP